MKFLPAAPLSPTRIAAAALAALAFGAIALPSHAGLAVPTPPDATFYFGTPNGSSVFPPSLPQVAGPGDYSRGSTTANLALMPSPQLTLDLGGPDFVGAAIVYNYRISGPFDASGMVAGTLTSSMSVSGTGLVSVAAGITGTNLDPSPNYGVCFSTTISCPVDNGLYSTSLQNHTFNVNFNPTGQIELAAVARVEFIGSAQAMVDPVITLPAGYTLELSAGVGNSIAAVPEPSTWLLFAAGMGLVGVHTRRRRAAA